MRENLKQSSFITVVIILIFLSPFDMLYCFCYLLFSAGKAAVILTEKFLDLHCAFSFHFFSSLRMAIY